MEVIKKYIYAIQRRLPAQNKDDIAKEINSLIFDELEGKFGKRDEYTNEEIEEVLKEMGHPREVAARYRGDKQLLIGPELFPIYKMVLAITAGATTLGLVISFIVKVINEAAAGDATLWLFASNFGQLLGGLFSALLGLVGSMTIIFAVIQHFGKFDEMDVDIYEDWKPKDLPDLPEEKDRVSRWEPIVGMIFIVFGAVLLNYYVAAGNIPYMVNPGSGISVLPIFSVEALKQYLPLWNLSLGLSFVLQIILLIQGKNTLGTRLFDIGISLLGIAILATMISGDMIISVEGLINEFGSHDWINAMQQHYYTFLKVIMGLSIFGIIVSVINLIVQQARKANV